jgi:CHAT domain-containing protein/lipoprotein NlpI
MPPSIDQPATGDSESPDRLQAGLEAARAKGDKEATVQFLTALGMYYSGRGKKQTALDYFDEARIAVRETGSREGEASILNIMGVLYNDLGQTKDALLDLNQALWIERLIGDSTNEAQTLNRIGTVYYTMGEQQAALDHFNLAMPVAKDLKDRRVEAITLNGIGLVYYTMGEEEKAQDNLGQALAMQLKAADRRGQAATLTGLGLVDTYLNQRQKALLRFQQALAIERAAGDRRDEAGALNNIGWVYDALGQKQKSLLFLNQALTMQRGMDDLAGEAYTLDSIGLVYRHLGQNQKALDIYNQALPIEREASERDCEANTLWGIGEIRREMGDAAAALRNEVAALSLAESVGDPDLKARINTSLLRLFREQHRTDTAILFGMDAVNSFQQMRKNISGLARDLQAGFVQSKSETYRELAELLVERDRLGEAEKVLDLLKEQELKEVVRGADKSAAASEEPLKLSEAQQKAQSELKTSEDTAAALTDMSAEYAALLAKPSRSPDEESRMEMLDEKVESGNREVMGIFSSTIFPELEPKVGVGKANDLVAQEKLQLSRLQNVLAGLGPRVLGIRLLLGQEHAYAIVVTAQGTRKIELQVTPEKLRARVLQVREELRSPASNPKPHLKDLYAMVVAPLEGELAALDHGGAAQNRVPTLLWSLDGVLRYVPVAALYDGKQFMVQRFDNVLFTSASYEHMKAPSNPKSSSLRVLAMGLSRSYGGLPALPGVMPELMSVVHDPAVPASHGPLNGKLLSDEQFTLAALKSQLGAGEGFPVVHIASHFIEDATGGLEPYLMLGGKFAGEARGYALTLSSLYTSTISFHGTQLITLSACSTARDDATKDGMEVDSLGMIAQQKDAEAVLATLWDVNDNSTSRLMSDFYRRWAEHPENGKGEALRQAQLAFLPKQAGAPQHSAKSRGLSVEEKPAPSAKPAGYSHPFYWAPFVLIGNFQ